MTPTRRHAWLTVGLGLVIGAAPALAQTADETRLALHINFGYQAASEALQDQLRFQAYGEEARIEAAHDITGGPLFDAGGFIRVWRALSVGGTFTQVEGTDDVALTGSVPHPIQVGNDRMIDPQALDLTHRERATHVHLAWLLPLPQVERLDLRIMGGPTYFNLTQDVVTGVVLSEGGGPPFSTVTVDQVVRGEVVRSVWGGHVGVDASIMLSPHVGVGGFARFARGSVDVPSGSTVVSLTVGGFQGGGGLRVRF